MWSHSEDQRQGVSLYVGETKLLGNRKKIYMTACIRKGGCINILLATFISLFNVTNRLNRFRFLRLLLTLCWFSTSVPHLVECGEDVSLDNLVAHLAKVPKQLHGEGY